MPPTPVTPIPSTHASRLQSDVQVLYRLAPVNSVEGAEAKVLETVDPTAFQVVMVERNSASEARVRQLMHKSGMIKAANVTVPFSDVWLRPGVQEVTVMGVVHPKRLSYTETKVSVPAASLDMVLHRFEGISGPRHRVATPHPGRRGRRLGG